MGSLTGKIQIPEKWYKWQWYMSLDLGRCTIVTERISFKLATTWLTRCRWLVRAYSPYGPMKSAIVVPQEKANIEKKPINDNYTIFTNDVFPHWLSPAERGHLIDINSSSSANNGNMTRFGTLGLLEVPHMWYGYMDYIDLTGSEPPKDWVCQISSYCHYLLKIHV